MLNQRLSTLLHLLALAALALAACAAPVTVAPTPTPPPTVTATPAATVTPAATQASPVGAALPATAFQFAQPSGITFDAAGNYYVSDCSSQQIYKIDTFGQLTVFAGTGTNGLAGDGGPARAADLDCPIGLAIGPDGALYFADFFNNRIRRIGADGLITTVAGNGLTGPGAENRFAGDGGPATSAWLYFPLSVAFDAAGNMYIVDGNNNRIRKVDPAGTITTFAGTGKAGFSGDGGLATAADLHLEIYGPGFFYASLAVAPDGSVYITDGGNNRVRKIDPQGIITTIAGGGADPLGNGGPATAVALTHLTGIALDVAGNVYVAEDSEIDSVRYGHVGKIDRNGLLTNFAGANVKGQPVDGQPAITTALGSPWGLATDRAGNLYIVEDVPNNRVRKVDTQGLITTVAGGRP